MRILYIFPHPDDESFGPAGPIWQQRRMGHEVYLLTLTKGGATRQRHRYGYTIQEMGEVRFREMLEVEKVLDLTGMRVLDMPDSGLKELDPRELEAVVADEIRRVKPDVVVTYAVHGISGFFDHLVIHGVVKRVFCELRESMPNLRRLALLTVDPDNPHLKESSHNLRTSLPGDIDCIIELTDEDFEKFVAALDCYKTYQQQIIDAKVVEIIGHSVPFEIFDENHDPPLSDLFEKLGQSNGKPD